MRSPVRIRPSAPPKSPEIIEVSGFSSFWQKSAFPKSIYKSIYMPFFSGKKTVTGNIDHFPVTVLAMSVQHQSQNHYTHLIVDGQSQHLMKFCVNAFKRLDNGFLLFLHHPNICKCRQKPVNGHIIDLFHHSYICAFCGENGSTGLYRRLT